MPDAKPVKPVEPVIKDKFCMISHMNNIQFKDRK